MGAIFSEILLIHKAYFNIIDPSSPYIPERMGTEAGSCRPSRFTGLLDALLGQLNLCMATHMPFTGSGEMSLCDTSL